MSGLIPADLRRLGFDLQHEGRGAWAVLEQGRRWPWAYKSRRDAISMIREWLGCFGRGRFTP